MVNFLIRNALSLMDVGGEVRREHQGGRDGSSILLFDVEVGAVLVTLVALDNIVDERLKDLEEKNNKAAEGDDKNKAKNREVAMGSTTDSL